MKMGKMLGMILAAGILVSILAGCGSENINQKITELKFLRNDGIELYVGKADNSYFTVDANGEFTVDDLEFVSSDSQVAANEVDKTALTSYVYYNIKGVSPGVAKVYVKAKAGSAKTEEITVTVKAAITSLEFFKSGSVDLKVGEKDNSYFLVKAGGEFTLDELEFVSGDPSVAVFEYDSTALNNYIYYNIKGVSKGTTKVYAQTKDGTVKTAEITVTVK